MRSKADKKRPTSNLVVPNLPFCPAPCVSSWAPPMRDQRKRQKQANLDGRFEQLYQLVELGGQASQKGRVCAIDTHRQEPRRQLR